MEFLVDNYSSFKGVLKEIIEDKHFLEIFDNIFGKESNP
jgi:hypothetical protein